MIEVPESLTERVNALFNEYGLDNLTKADVLGQIAVNLEGCHMGNTYPWLTGGIVYKYVMKHNVIDTLKKLSSLLLSKKETASGLNYNDMDCDLTAVHLITPYECLDCTALVAKVEAKSKGNPPPETKNCPTCKGTGKDPRFNEYSWIIRYENHGYTTFYIIHENFGKTEFHVRELKYNAPKAQVKKALKDLIEAIPRDCYDTDCMLIKYRDARDNGFVLSMEHDKPETVSEEFPMRHECEVINQRAIYAIHTVVEHFPCVIESLEKGEEL